jgi:hypothetical protein
VRGNGDGVNGALVNLHLGTEGRLRMACGTVAPGEVVVATSKAGGGRRTGTGCAGPKGLELGRLWKNSKEKSNWDAKAI